MRNSLGSSSVTGPPLLTDDSPELLEITCIGETRRPLEACGVLLPTPYADSRVIELPNRLQSEGEFAIWGSDIRLSLSGWLAKATQEEIAQMTIWHTHPEGNIGPSRVDLAHRLPGVYYLVVALTNDGPVPTYYSKVT